MKKLLKEIGLYILVAVVLANLTVNFLQNNYNTLIMQSLETTANKLKGNTKFFNSRIDKINNDFTIQNDFNKRKRQDLSNTIKMVKNSMKQNSTILNDQQINIDLLKKITKLQKKPDFERLLTATVEIITVSGVGAGICISEDTNYYYILTVQHIVTPRLGNIVSIRTRDKLIYAGEVLKEDPNVDLALVRLGKWKDTRLATVKLANNEPEVRDRVFVVGHPLGTHWTITEG